MREQRMITPETRVGELLEAYPFLEAKLVELSPAFRKLRNPVLKRTVARVTTLRHAAKVGGVGLGRMINELRAAAGIEASFDEGAPSGENRQPPAWFPTRRVEGRLDVRPLLESGEHPLGKVLAELARLAPGAVCEVTAPFVPAPLIDVARQRGLEAWWEEAGPEVVKVYFYRPASPDGPSDESSLVGLD